MNTGTVFGAKRPCVITAAAAIALLFTGCAPAGTGQPSAPPGTGPVQVATSTDVYADIVHAIGGDKVDVTPIIHSPSQDPHSYQGTTQDKLAVSKAQLLIENGGGYDDFFTTLAGDNNTPGHQLLNVTELSGLSPDSTPAADFNEHLWYNRRLHGEIGYIPPAEAETVFYSNLLAIKTMERV